MEAVKVRSFRERNYQMVPLDRIKVLNTRDREKGRFQEIVRSIKDANLRIPIVVNERNLKRTGYYDLICGEGRFLAYKSLGHTSIPADVWNCSRKEAYICSLVENLARVPPGTMWFAREVKRMHDSGWTLAQISGVVGQCESYLRDYIRLVERGEERLLKGVEDGLFSMSFAMQVMRSDDAGIQNLLMDAYDKGMLNCKNLPAVRRLIECRDRNGRARESGGGGGKTTPEDYSVQKLAADITRVTKEKASFVRETAGKENRLLSLLDGINALWRDKDFVALLKADGLDQRPKLEGSYGV